MDINYYKSLEPIFGNWRITDLIGEGSFGKVFEIERRDEAFDKCYKAALKVISIPYSSSEIDTLKSEGMDEPSIKGYFKDIVNDVIEEYDIMSKLKGNSYIVSCEDYTVVPKKDQIGWDILIRMELLTPLVKQLGDSFMDDVEVVKLGIDLCRALENCQKFNIIHRDIKPENIFVSEIGDYKLGDFGIARTAEKTSSSMSRKGTYTYMAPEVYHGEAYGKSVDIYSIGIVMYRLLNKNRAPLFPPYPDAISYSDKENAVSLRMKGESLPAPVDADAELSRIVLKASSFKPGDRYASPTIMREELEFYLKNRMASYGAVTLPLSNDEKDEVDLDKTLSLKEEMLKREESNTPLSPYGAIKVSDEPIKETPESDTKEIVVERIKKAEMPEQEKSSTGKERKNINPIIWIIFTIIILLLCLLILRPALSNNKKKASSQVSISNNENDRAKKDTFVKDDDKKKEPISSTDIYTIPDIMTISLKDDGDGKLHYAVVEVVIVMDTTHENYEKYKNMDEYRNLIKADIVDVVSKHTMDELTNNREEIEEEMTQQIRLLYASSFVSEVKFSSCLCQ